MIRLADVGLYTVLASHADQNGECWPAQERLALLAGISIRQVRRMLDRLVSTGVLQRVPKGHWPNDLYILPEFAKKPDMGVRSDRTPVSANTGHGCPPNYTQRTRTDPDLINGSKSAFRDGTSGRSVPSVARTRELLQRIGRAVP